jgi:tRNA (cmo5U34)-methyltransferase
MGAASHLGIRLADYDRSIRAFIPHYEEMLDAAASALLTLDVRAPVIVELGIGSGALARRGLDLRPAARVVGIDADENILATARRRVPRLTTIVGDFQTIDLPACDVFLSSFALHHIRTKQRKSALYRRARNALRPGGLFVNADCCLATSRPQQESDRSAWLAHLQASYSRRKARAFLDAWGREDVYQRLADEIRLLEAVGFTVDLTWRRDSFAVLVARKPSGRRG